MEFFLQTLVKKKILAQNKMLILNQVLMVASTFPAIQVLWLSVTPWIFVVSLCLNLANRGHEIFNVTWTAVFAYLWTTFSPDQGHFD